MKNDIKNHADKRFKALVTLAAYEGKQPEECVSDTRLAEFIDQRLGSEEREEILAHLNLCQACFSRCMHASSLSSPEKKRGDLIRNAYKLFAGVATAATIIFCVLISGLFPPTISTRIDNAYHVLLKSNDKNSLTIPELPWEIKNKSYSFAAVKRKETLNQAFAGGLYSGKIMFDKSVERIMPDFLVDRATGAAINWEDTPYETYYQLGRWCFFIKVLPADLAGVKEGFAKEQGKIVTGFITRLEKVNETGLSSGNTELALNRLRGIKMFLDLKTTVITEKKSMKRLKGEVAIIGQLLAP